MPRPDLYLVGDLPERPRLDPPKDYPIGVRFRRTRMERITDALASERAFFLYVGVYIGIMLTCASAVAWTAVLS